MYVATTNKYLKPSQVALLCNWLVFCAVWIQAGPGRWGYRPVWGCKSFMLRYTLLVYRLLNVVSTPETPISCGLQHISSILWIWNSDAKTACGQVPLISKLQIKELFLSSTKKVPSSVSQDFSILTIFLQNKIFMSNSRLTKMEKQVNFKHFIS